MDYIKEYVELCCNTYCDQSYINGLKQLKKSIGEDNHPLSLLIDGDLAFFNAQFKECKNLYQKAYDTDDKNHVFNCKMLIILDFLEQEELLQSSYFKVIEMLKDPLSVATKMLLHISNNDFNNFTIEYFQYKQLLGIDPRLKSYYEAVYLSIQGDYTKSYNILRTLYETSEFNSDVCNDLAHNIMFRQGKFDSGIDILKDGLKKNEKNYKLHNNLLSIYFYQKDYDNVSEHFKFCMSAIPESFTNIYYRFFYELSVTKNYTKAIEYANKAYEIKQIPIILINKIYCYLGLKEFDNALKYALEMTDIFPEDSLSYHILGIVFYDLKKDKNEISDTFAKSIGFSKYTIKEESYFSNNARKDYLQVQEELFKDQDMIIHNIISDYKVYKSLGFVDVFEKYTRTLDIKEIICIMTHYLTMDNSNIEFFKPLIFILRNNYKIYESAKVLECLLNSGKDANLFFDLSQKYVDFGDKTCAVRILKKGREYFKSVSEIVRFSIMMSTCGYPATATQYLKLYLEKNMDTLKTEDIQRITETRHYLFQLFRDRKRDKKLDKILFESILIQEQVNLKEDEFEYFLRKKSQTNDDIIFHNLRKWNSYTPILSMSGADSVGGGFYINVKGKGIVIDPGLNFVENFKNAGYTFGDIDTIFVSHAHNDHTADLESILTLLYKYNSNIKKLYEMQEKQNEQKSVKELSSHDGLKNTSYIEVGTLDHRFELKKSKKNLSKHIKVLKIYMTKSTFKKYAGIFSLHKKSNYRIHLIEGGKDYPIFDDNKDFGVYVFNNEHIEVISDYSSVGMVFKLKHYNLVYTGDTRISDNILESVKSTIKKTKLTAKNKQIFLCNIGGLKQSEVEYDLNNYLNVYKNHLGRIGVYKLIQEFKPKLCLISEFGEEFEMQRLAITDVFDRNFPNTCFFPCEIGQKIKIEEELLIQTHYISSLEKGVPEYKEKYESVTNIKYIDDIYGNIYYVDNKIVENHLSDFKRYKGNNR